MSAEFTLHTGEMGDETSIHVSWFDHNNCRKTTDVVIKIEPYDKPRTLTVLVDTRVVHQEPAAEQQTAKILADGFYWHLPKRRHVGLYIEDWTIVKVRGGDITYTGNDMEFPIEDCPGKFQRIPDHDA